MEARKTVGNTAFQKKANEALVLSILRKRGPCSRLELAEATGLRQSTVTYIIDRLLSRRIIREAEASISSGKRGQRPIPIAIDGSFGSILGIDICRGKCRFTICDIAGVIVHSGDLELDENIPFAERFKQCHGVAKAEAKKRGIKVVAVGLSVSGVVDASGSIIKRSWSEGLTNFDVRQSLGLGFRVPVMVENDARCCATAKLWEAGGGAPTFLYVFLRSSPGRGGALPLSIGIGIVVNGAVYRGVSDYAGEFRSAFPSRSGKSQLSVSEEELKRFDSDGMVARRVVDEIVSNLVPIIILLNPSELYIGGDIAVDSGWMEDVIAEDLNAQKNLPQISDCSLSISPTARVDASYGACANVLSAIYSIPAIGMPASRADLGWDAILGE